MDQTKTEGANKVVIVGWAVSLLGMALWIYGYFVAGNPSLINWSAHVPEWVAAYLPNLESEIGMVFCFAGMVPIYWPRRD